MEFKTFPVNETVRFRYYNPETEKMEEEGQIQNYSEDFITSLKAGNVVFLSLFDENKEKIPVNQLSKYSYFLTKVSNYQTFLLDFKIIKNSANVDLWYRAITNEYFYLVLNAESKQYFLINATMVYPIADEDEEMEEDEDEDEDDKDEDEDDKDDDNNKLSTDSELKEPNWQKEDAGSPRPAGSIPQKLFWRQPNEPPWVKNFNDHLVKEFNWIEVTDYTDSETILLEIINYIYTAKREKDERSEKDKSRRTVTDYFCSRTFTKKNALGRNIQNEAIGVSESYLIDLLIKYLISRTETKTDPKHLYYNIILYYDAFTRKPYSVIVYCFKQRSTGQNKWFIEPQALCSDQTERNKAKGFFSILIEELQKSAELFKVPLILKATENAVPVYKHKNFKPTTFKTPWGQEDQGLTKMKSNYTRFRKNPRRSDRTSIPVQKTNLMKSVKRGGGKTLRRRRTHNRFTRRNRLTKKRVRARRHTFRSMRRKANATKRTHKR